MSEQHTRYWPDVESQTVIRCTTGEIVESAKAMRDKVSLLKVRINDHFCDDIANGLVASMDKQARGLVRDALALDALRQTDVRSER